MRLPRGTNMEDWRLRFRAKTGQSAGKSRDLSDLKTLGKHTYSAPRRCLAVYL